MKKAEQAKINTIIEEQFPYVEKEQVIRAKRLRTCSARVYETENYYILQSYYTYVAFIDKRNGVLYDCLRFTWGHSNTSVQHIAKFAHDYAAEDRLTWREV